MLLTEIEHIFKKELSGHLAPEEIQTAFIWLLEDICQLERFALVFQPELVADHKQEEQFFSALSRLKQNEPLQYITGKAPFIENEYRVNPSVLIPRPETEELVVWVDDFLKSSEETEANQLLDIGTGSGCIAIELAKRWPEMQVHALDVSQDALSVAETNAHDLGIKVHFHHFNILVDSWEQEQDFKAIVSNPPYVLEKEKEEILERVKGHEPEKALFVPDADPLLFYRHIAAFGKKHLASGGALFFEINALMADLLFDKLGEWGYTQVKLQADFRGKPRFIKAQID